MPKMKITSVPWRGSLRRLVVGCFVLFVGMPAWPRQEAERFISLSQLGEIARSRHGAFVGRVLRMARDESTGVGHVPGTHLQIRVEEIILDGQPFLDDQAKWRVGDVQSVVDGSESTEPSCNNGGPFVGGRVIVFPWLSPSRVALSPWGDPARLAGLQTGFICIESDDTVHVEAHRDGAGLVDRVRLKLPKFRTLLQTISKKAWREGVAARCAALGCPVTTTCLAGNSCEVIDEAIPGARSRTGSESSLSSNPDGLSDGNQIGHGR